MLLLLALGTHTNVLAGSSSDRGCRITADTDTAESTDDEDYARKPLSPQDDQASLDEIESELAATKSSGHDAENASLREESTMPMSQVPPPRPRSG